MAKKKQIMYLDHITVPVFKQKINLVFAKGGPYQAIFELDHLASFAELYHKGNIVDAAEYLKNSAAMVTNIKDFLYIILPLKSTHGVIAHEVYHLAKMILNSRGVVYCDESEESYAYLIEWLTDEIYKYHNILQKKLLKK